MMTTDDEKLRAYEAEFDGSPPPDEPPWASRNGSTPGDHAARVARALADLHIRAEAKETFDAQRRPAIALPAPKSLTQLLAEPDASTPYLIERVAPAKSRVVLAAQYKAGKTTLRDNLVRSLVDGGPFLGCFKVVTPGRRVAIVDNELSPDMARRWLRAQNIENTARVADMQMLRGSISTFNIIDDRIRGLWAKRYRDLGIQYLILDCLRPILDALGLNEHTEAGLFLAAFDALLHEAEIDDSSLVTHMGHNGERSRGDSRIQDWPDAIWRMVRESDKPDSARYFSAFGRDVDVPEGRLSFDPQTRRLSLSDGQSRRDTHAEAAAIAVIKVLAAARQPMSGRAIQDAAPEGHSRDAIRGGTEKAVHFGLVKVMDGPRRSKLHAVNHPCESCGMPVAAGGTRHESCADVNLAEVFQ